MGADRYPKSIHGADSEVSDDPIGSAVDFGVQPFPASRDEVRVSEDDDISASSGVKVGDMVWGKVKSHPWWPGHVFNEAFVTPSVRRSKVEGHVLVAFFGDSSYGYFDPTELIPFVPNYADKSRQTSSRTFVKAVDEAVDEISRREAVGLTCYCRTQSNFRPTRIPKHFAVDVLGYEPGGIYSSKQIKSSRDRFKPEKMLSFLREVCSSPMTGAHASIEQIRMVAQLQAYRKAVFEEFDDTYAQAFGVEPVRPFLNSRGVSDQPEKFARRAALLSGQLRTPAAKPATPKASAKQQSAKKNKYVLKRRDDDSGAILMPSLPEFPSSSEPISSAPPDFAVKPAEFDDGMADLMLKMSPTHSVPVVNQDTVACVNLEPIKKEEPVDPISDSNSENVIGNAVVPSTEDHLISEDANDRPVEPAGSVLSIKKGKTRKRGLEESQDSGGELEGSEGLKKKKRKKKELVSEDVEDAQAKALLKRQEGASVINLPPVDLPSLQLGFPQLLADYKQLALDPFYGVKSNTPIIALHVFLKYRSLVYQKSLVLPLPNDQVDQNLRASAKVLQKSTITESSVVSAAAVAPKEQNEPSLKPMKPALKPEDSTKSGRKRILSDRQGEISEKRQKKLEKLKALPVEKKAALAQKPAEGHQQQQQKEANKTVAPSALPVKPLVKATIAVATESLKKQEQPTSQSVVRTPSPTNLIMKFPPMSTLPSIASLKAKLAKYGQLDQSATRVYWKTYTCKVLFKFRADAEAALIDLRDRKDLFGQLKVSYFIREVEATDLPTEPPRPKSSEGLQSTSGNGAHGKSTVLSQLRRPIKHMTAGQPKSILKKPGNEVGVGANARDVPRVKFMLDDSEPREEPPAASHPLFISNTNGRNNGDGPSFYSHKDPPLSKILGSISVRPPPPPMVTRPTLECNDIDDHCLLSPMSNSPFEQPLGIRAPVDVSHSRPVIHFTNGHEGQSALQSKLPVDISDQMLRLLVRCSDIVLRIKTSGYAPYNPL